jgi:hypothetical protein
VAPRASDALFSHFDRAFPDSRAARGSSREGSGTADGTLG